MWELLQEGLPTNQTGLKAVFQSGKLFSWPDRTVWLLLCLSLLVLVENTRVKETFPLDTVRGVIFLTGDQPLIPRMTHVQRCVFSSLMCFSYLSGLSRLETKANLTIYPSLIKNNQNVRVAWDGVANPTAKDIIALYCPEYSKDNEYIDYFNADVSPTYAKGYGKHSVQLINFRTNCEMRYFGNFSKEHQELVATSNIVKFEGGPEQPLQVHLALTGNPSEMRVMWVSGTGILTQTWEIRSNKPFSS